MGNNIIKYVCSSCGAKNNIPKDEILINCIYCGSSIALIKNDIESLNIKKIIPFNISENEIKIKALAEHFKSKNIKNINQVFIPYYSGIFKYKSEIVYNDDNNKKINKSTKCEIEDIVEKTLFAPEYYDKFSLESYDLFDIKNVLTFNQNLIKSNQKIDTKNKFNFEKTAKEKALNKINYNKLYFASEFVENLDVVTHIKYLKIEKEAILIPFYEIIFEDDKKIYMIGDSNLQNKKKKNQNFVTRKRLVSILSIILFYNIVFFLVIFTAFNKDIKQGITNFGLYLNINFIFSIIIIISIIINKKKYPFKKIKEFKLDNNYYFYDKEV